MVDLGFRGFFENVFSNVADFQLGTALQRDNREKVKEVVRNKALIDILHIYFENGVRIRQVFPVVAVATLSVWGSVEELVTKGPGFGNVVLRLVGLSFAGRDLCILFPNQPGKR